MHSVQKRLLTIAGMTVLAVPLTAVAIAYACTSIATVSTDKAAALATTTVTVNGKGFTPHNAGDTTTDTAKIRFDDIDGAVIATANPSSAADGGKFSVQIQVPAGMAAGDHVLLVTQNGSDGRPAYGTPARQVFTVLAPVVTPAASTATSLVPALGAAFVIPTLTEPSGDDAKLTKAVASCKRKFSTTKAKTKAGRRSMARKRATCITSAEKKYA
jgi:hypothetical protein